jgi:hypothetical protein
MPSLETLLSHLVRSNVEMILVGGLAAVVQGAPITTHDLDLVPRRTEPNIRLLIDALHAIDARYRGRAAGELLRPTLEILLGPGHSLLQTQLGPVDILGAIEGGRDYDALLPNSRTLEIDGRLVRLLDLATIVELKRTSTRLKDQRMLPILEETLRRR